MSKGEREHVYTLITFLVVRFSLSREEKSKRPLACGERRLAAMEQTENIHIHMHTHFSIHTFPVKYFVPRIT